MRSKGFLGLAIVLLLVLFAGCAGCDTYNRMVSLDEGVERAWGDVQSQYQRRSDLIPNLVNTVRGAAEFERSTLESVTEARTRATSIQITADDLDDPERVAEFLEAQRALGSSLGRLIAVAEAYPQLQATEAFRDLTVQLEGTENRIATARRDYNGAVRTYNTAIRRFPASIIAGMTGFDRKASFEAEAGAEEAPEVRFD